MNTQELTVHLTGIVRAFDEGMDFTMLSDAEQQILSQKIIAASVSLQGLAAELELTKPVTISKGRI